MRILIILVLIFSCSITWGRSGELTEREANEMISNSLTMGQYAVVQSMIDEESEPIKDEIENLKKWIFLFYNHLISSDHAYNSNDFDNHKKMYGEYHIPILKNQKEIKPQ